MERKQVYKCEVCGNIVEVLEVGGGELVCCGQPMTLLQEMSGDQGTEKHTPIIEETGSGVLVKVGEIEHPMLPEHHIVWIEVVTGDGTLRQYLQPGQKPEAEFAVSRSEIIKAREYCNVHGLWKSA